MKIDDGGPAFPRAGCILEGEWYCPNDGMDLRDYFAAKAMAALVGKVKFGPRQLADWSPQDAAAHAYLVADAMLAQRAKEPT